MATTHPLGFERVPLDVAIYSDDVVGMIARTDPMEVITFGGYAQQFTGGAVRYEVTLSSSAASRIWEALQAVLKEGRQPLRPEVEASLRRRAIQLDGNL